MNNCKGPQANMLQNVGCKEDLVNKNIPALQISMRTSVLVLRALSCSENVTKETVFSLFDFWEPKLYGDPGYQRFESKWSRV